MVLGPPQLVRPSSYISGGRHSTITHTPPVYRCSSACISTYRTTLSVVHSLPLAVLLLHLLLLLSFLSLIVCFKDRYRWKPESQHYLFELAFSER
jgi:hypothetical protein